MKRSENVGLVVMGAAAFAATFAGGMAYFVMQKPSHAAQTQTAAADPRCVTRPEGRQDCQPRRSGFSYYFYGWSWGGSRSEPARRDVAFAGKPSSGAVSGIGIERSGFGSTAHSGSFRVAAGG